MSGTVRVAPGRVTPGAGPVTGSGPAAGVAAPGHAASGPGGGNPDASGVRPSKRLALDFPEGAEELIGCTLGGRYRIESIIGRGGMGTVYLARHAVIGRTFALKVLRREIVTDPPTVQRFLNEARIAGGLAHENLVPVLDFGEVTRAELPSLGDLKQPYLVMELLEGETLADRIQREGPIAPAVVREVFRQAASGLALAHDKGIVHRDLKPDNVFLLKGAGVRAKVLDFGVAKLLSGPKLTRKGTVFGTPYYMSPEQASGQELDGRTDVYALGVVMYEALTGRVPFDDDTLMGVMTKHLFAVPDPIETVVRDRHALGALGPVVMRCLEKRAEARYQTCQELAAALSSNDPARAAPQPLRPTIRDPSLAGAAPRVAPTVVDRRALPAAPTSSGSAPLVIAAIVLSLAAAILGYFVYQKQHRAAALAASAVPRAGGSPVVEASSGPGASPNAPSPSITSTPVSPTAAASARASASVPVAPRGGPAAAPSARSPKGVDPNVW